jgi:molybdate transport system substrate-binding protein
MHRLRAWRVWIVTVALLAAGCGGSQEPAGGADGAGGGRAPGLSGEVTVFAAASLTEAFDAIQADFTRANPGVTVRYNFAGSQALVGQIQQGAPADVFASADERNMARLVGAALTDGQPQVFAGNALQIVVPKGNPDGVTGLADLARPGLKVVLAAEEVPVGAYSRQALGKAGVTVTPVSQEDSVKAVVTKVGLGEADAGIAYATDVTAAGDRVEGVAIPAGQNVPATYPVAVVKDARNPAAARAFVDYLRSQPGQATLRRFGFLPAGA